jgi:L-threonylcarbamoyladenylate synthase
MKIFLPPVAYLRHARHRIGSVLLYLQRFLHGSFFSWIPRFPESRVAVDYYNIPKDLGRVAQLLRDGGVVAFPTETVFGVGAIATHEKALCRLHACKRRPQGQPISLLASDLEMALGYWKLEAPWYGPIRQLAATFWPGPLTMIAPAKPEVSPWVTGGTGTVGIRVPAVSELRDLIRMIQTPIAAASANRSGETTEASVDGVVSALGQDLDAVVSGSIRQQGVPSTVAKVAPPPIEILRVGGLAPHRIQDALHGNTAF